MGWTREFFASNIGRKVVMSLTGLFLSIFLIAHLSGNLLLFVGQQAFNEYSHFMATNPFIRIVEIILFISIIFHVIYAIVLTINNRKARAVKYAVSNSSENSSWFSRNMGIFGTIIFIFLVLHLGNFFVAARFENLPKIALDNGQKVKDLYTVVVTSFEQWWYTAIYVIAMVVLGFHLVHGVHSAFRSLGLRHYKYIPLVKNIAIAFAILFPAGFASIPIYFFIDSLT
ncbi:MAG: succinate dehydrogenase [Bacteroidetes bacterium SW_11_45_7]|nr:MAG: succinate dehydrogenase [Bacteroidetes bacterium SW_11_45_7]